MLQDPPQVLHVLRPLGIGEPARGEHPCDLPVELGAVGDDDDRRLLLRLVAAELERQPQHRQALARALRMPDDAAPLARFARRPDPPHRLVHGDELLVAGQLADGAAAVDLEHDEVADDVEQVPRFEEPVPAGCPAAWACARASRRAASRSGDTAPSIPGRTAPACRPCRRRRAPRRCRPESAPPRTASARPGPSRSCRPPGNGGAA